MLIGILSDSHGHADTTALAVAILKERGAEILLHLGDIGNEQVIDELVGCNARIVFGNCDWDWQALNRYAQLVGVVVEHPMGIYEADGKRIAFTHGHLAVEMTKALKNQVDYLLHGHTHETSDRRQGKTRIINPGALFRASRYTTAVLDPLVDELNFIDIPKPSIA